MAIYNCKHSGDQYQITKFNRHGEVESSYLCSHAECACPAGVRDTCRHRLMLPTFLEHNLVNSHLFLDWDRGRHIVDFNGQPALAPQAHTDTCASILAQSDSIEPTDIRSPGDLYGEKEFMTDMFAKDVTPATKPANLSGWRRW